MSVPGPTAAAAPATPAPLASDAAQILNAIAALERRLDGFERRLDDVQRETAIIGNMVKGTGSHLPYTEVLFMDGSRPSEAVPSRAALPALLNVQCIRSLTDSEAEQYLAGYGIVPIPQDGAGCRTRVAQCVGCVVQL
ncbi:hypothetical protein FB451DRAFT_1561913 [Mycena latifolia]|nr:hypothetical protein FB451DRAFT_1561913 [Mycena latifolia]